jgi:hypothetical protein
MSTKLPLAMVFLAMTFHFGCAVGGSDTDDDGGDSGRGGSSGASDPSANGANTTSSGSGNPEGGGGSDSSGGGVSGGETCSDAYDLNGVSMPAQMSGQYTDSPLLTGGGSCAPAPYNVAWFTFTPSSSDYYLVSANNGAAYAQTRVAIFESNSCNPYGGEVACETSESTAVSATAYLESGQQYLIMFYTDSAASYMLDPSIEVDVAPPPPNGTYCSNAVDVGSSLVSSTGTFDDDPTAQGSCVYSSPTNAFWFSYTPSATDSYRVIVSNATTTYAYSRLVAFQGASCSPLGSEIACETNSSKTVSAELTMTAGQTYTFLAHTDGESYTMVNPSVTVQPLSGVSCSDPEDVSSASFPHTLYGDFTDAPAAGGSCDTSPTNVAWYRYVPSVSGNYSITGHNNTSDNAYSRLAVFQGDGCSPLGTERACVSTSSLSATVSSVALTAGTPYRIMFYTDGSSWGMEDPELTIAQVP